MNTPEAEANDAAVRTPSRLLGRGEITTMGAVGP